MACVADVNVLLPLLTEGHRHHAPADAWWQRREDEEVGLSLPVRMGLLRLLTNSRVMGSGTLRPSQAWDAVQCLIDDPRVVIMDAVPAEHAKFWHDNVARRQPTPNLWTDAWLAALAQSNDCELVTFDRGFRSFPRLKLHLLDPAD